MKKILSYMLTICISAGLAASFYLLDNYIKKVNKENNLYHKFVEKIDANKDGHLSNLELSPVFDRLGKQMPSDSYALLDLTPNDITKYLRGTQNGKR